MFNLGFFTVLRKITEIFHQSVFNISIIFEIFIFIPSNRITVAIPRSFVIKQLLTKILSGLSIQYFKFFLFLLRFVFLLLNLLRFRLLLTERCSQSRHQISRFEIIFLERMPYRIIAVQMMFE